jgi:hypothetical protein
VTGGGGLAGIDVADDDEGNVNLLLGPGVFRGLKGERQVLERMYVVY